MNDFTTRSVDTPRAPVYLTEQRRENKLFQWWYRIASPPEPASLTNFKENERFRRGRTGSLIILALYLLLLVSLPSGFYGTNPFLASIIVAVLIALTAAMVLNRMKKVNLAGAIVVLAFIAYPTINLVTTPGGLNMMALPLYGLLVLPLLCTVSFLPAWWVFPVAASNCLFTLLSLAYLPKTAELSAILDLAFVGIVTPIILSQMIVSIVAYFWVNGATKALIRAGRAEEIAKLEHDLARQAEAAAQQKQQLEASIQKIVHIHTRVANGDFEARVPLTQDNMLWQVSGSLNNLLGRMQRMRQESIHIQQMTSTLQRVYEENGRLKEMLRNTVN
jgi:hypothetical protein